jgi:hypothetical protein
MHYNQFKHNIYSQNGEAGIIVILLKELNLEPKNLMIVEIGAWDGAKYSNVKNLIDQGSSAIMIEPCLVDENCSEKYLSLKKLPETHSNVKTLNYFIKTNNKQQTEHFYNIVKESQTRCGVTEWSPELKTLDECLMEIPNFDPNYDILNIDIDSYDHDVWNEHTMNPKIVIIEIHSALQPAITDKSNGYSFADSLEIGIKKGYTCVCHTGNMIYVRNDLLEKLSISKELFNSTELFDKSWL